MSAEPFSSRLLTANQLRHGCDPQAMEFPPGSLDASRAIIGQDRATRALKFGLGIRVVETIEEGIEILTGVPAGQRQEDGAYAPDTLNARVEARLQALGRALNAFKERDSSHPEDEHKDPVSGPK